MNAQVLTRIGQVHRSASGPLQPAELPEPVPGPGQVRIRVHACGVCHTELDEIEGRTAPPSLPVVPGHQVVGRVDLAGPGASLHDVGDRVGVGWLFSSCGDCAYCRSGRENLCDQFVATGRDADGGYSEYLVAPEKSVFPIPELFTDQEAAPLLCGGAVGYRALQMAGMKPGQSLGFYGFGASAHLVLPIARHLYPDTPLFVFTRSEDKQAFAKEMGAHWAGPPGAEPPRKPDAIIDTTPVWSAVEQSMRILAPGGRLVINAIRKTDEDRDSLLKIDYATHLWMEKTLVTVANVTGNDIRGALALAAEIPLRPTVQSYPFGDANSALADLAEGKGRGAKVLSV